MNKLLFIFFVFAWGTMASNPQETEVSPFLSMPYLHQQLVVEILLESREYKTLAALAKTNRATHRLVVAKYSQSERTALKSNPSDSALPASMLLGHIAGLTDNRDEFDAHHRGVMQAISPQILRQGIVKGLYTGILRPGPFHTPASKYYYHPEQHVEFLGTAPQLLAASQNLSLLPPQLNTLTQLKDLSLASNNLISIQFIENLSDLRWLMLNRNNLTSLPESIGNLSNLKTLEILNNPLTRLPHSLLNLTNLERLCIDAHLDDDPKTRALIYTLQWKQRLLGRKPVEVSVQRGGYFGPIPPYLPPILINIPISWCHLL